MHCSFDPDLSVNIRSLLFMKGNQLRRCVLTLMAIGILSSYGQSKRLSYDQAFKSQPNAIYKELPSFVKWLNDDSLLIRENGKHVIVHIPSGRRSAYTETITPRFSAPKDAQYYVAAPNGELAAVVRNNDLYIRNQQTGAEQRITRDGNDSLLNGVPSWVYEEEITGRKTACLWWSRDARYLAFMRFDESNVPVFQLYQSPGKTGTWQKQRFPQPGDHNPRVRIGIVEVATSKITWADFNENDDQYFGIPFFAPNNQLWVKWLNRAQNNLKLYAVDPLSGAKREVYDEKQPTWVAIGEGVTVRFLEDGKHFVLRSYRSGWPHFYLHEINGREIRQLTSGEYSCGFVIKTDPEKKLMWFTARKENSARTDIYEMKTDRNNLRRVTKGDYNLQDVYFSPSNKYMVVKRSNIHTPDHLVVLNFKGELVRELGNAEGADYTNYALPEKTFNRVKTTDGKYELPVVITYPIGFDSTKKYPVMLYVYGGPNAGKVYDEWNMPLADIWWAQEGMIQVTADNRSSGHFGKKGMDEIHRRTGIAEIEDFMAVGRWLKQQPWADSSKLAIMGYSFGGYMTCMALTYGADVFNYGLAHWPNTNWQLYDTHYTERYMDSPEENPEGYKITSVEHYAHRYKGFLRIVHGTADDNVHPQHVLQVADTLQNLGKHFELSLYPGQGHGFRGDKWLHNKNETARFYYRYLLNKPIPDFLK